MKFVVAVLVVVGVSCMVSAKSCEPLLHCKTCLDETHCKDCPDGYNLDLHQVCRYDCSKFGNCTVCTEKKCTECSSNMEWDTSLGICVSTSCTDEDAPACEYCGKGYDIIDVNGNCKTCATAFGEGCLSCTASHCVTVDDQHEILGAVSVPKNCGDSCPSTCAARFPGCSQCSDDVSSCSTCSANAELDDGYCKFKYPTCDSGDLYYTKGKFVCGQCSEIFGDMCVKCSSRGCSQCRNNLAVGTDGTCMNCSALFPGCALCTVDGCRSCRSSRWIFTPNGCFDQAPYVPPKESNAGMVVGIVIACLVLIVVIVLAVYCVVTSTSKKGSVDPSLYEDDFEFKSMSTL